MVDDSEARSSFAISLFLCKALSQFNYSKEQIAISSPMPLMTKSFSYIFVCIYTHWQ